MKKGKILALDTPSNLKMSFGYNFRLTITPLRTLNSERGSIFSDFSGLINLISDSLPTSSRFDAIMS
jgi:hypothetical protein